MTALWVKGSTIVNGTNLLGKKAHLMSDHYNNICGVHAELACWHNAGREMRGGTIYVAGRKAKSDAILLNTRPCAYCSALLESTRVNFVVFLQDGKFTKTKVRT